MQSASQAYRDSMEYGMYRNNGYIKVSLGVVNQLAQETAVVDSSGLYYFSGGDIFSGESPSQIYATAEQDFSKVDGTMYFAPASGTASSAYYNQGAVSNNLLGNIRITFNGTTDLDIKGFTIDFGDAYPTRFTITTDSVTKTYDNDSRYFKTEDTFDGTSTVMIAPISMVNGQGRIRILSFTCGIANIFTNSEVINYTSKEYVSPICDSLPSMDMTITIDNQDQYYNPDNPDSALAYMEVGQVMTVQFGYDVDGEGMIEWLPAQIAHLKSWSATDTDAKFTAVDKFDYLLNGKFIKGKYYPYGITLYNLAIEVLKEAGITDSSEYYIDDYLKKIVVYNPLPLAKYSECLQIIANAGRCCLYIDREDRIHIAGNFIPTATATAWGYEAEYSNVANITQNTPHPFYANASEDFTTVNGDLLFGGDGATYENTGYAGDLVAGNSGRFSPYNQTIAIQMESEYVHYSFSIHFKNTYATEFYITYYKGGEIVDEKHIQNNRSMTWTTNEQSVSFDAIYLEFANATPNSRVFVDYVDFGDATDYTLYRGYQLTGSPIAERQNRVQSIAVTRHTFSTSTESKKSLKSETITIPVNQTVYKDLEFSNYSYNYSIFDVSYSGATAISYGISEQGTNFARVYFYATGTDGNYATVTYSLYGNEYVVTDSDLTNDYHASGDIITWNNPLVSEVSMAQDIADWLGDYYLGDVTYQIPWRGDPRVDANDLFNLELKTGETTLIRAYQNELTFNGGWSGTLHARKYGGKT